MKILIQSFSDKSRLRQSLIDFSILLLLLGLNAFLTIGRITFSPKLALSYNKPHDLLFTIIITLLNIGLVTLFFYRHKEKLQKNEIVVLSLFGVFALLKLFPLLIWNQGAINFVLPTFNDGSVSFLYPSFSAIELICAYLMEMQFYGLFVFLFLATPRIEHAYTTYYLYFVLFIILGVILSMVIYSIVINYKEYANNIVSIFTGRKEYYIGICSYVLNRNAFGYFLMIGCLISLICFSKFYHVAWYISGLLFNFITLIIFSKTPFFITTALTIGVSIAYFIRNIKTKTLSSILILAWNILFYSYLALSYFFFPTFYETIIAPVIDTLTETHTVVARQNLNVPSLYMLTYNPFSFLFGYSQYHYINIYFQYSRFLPVYQSCFYTSHNSFLDVLTSNGILNTGLIASFFVYYIGKDILLYFKKNWVHALSVLAIWILLSAYSFLEPRMLFLMEGTCLFFILILLLQKIDKGETNPFIKYALVKNLNLDL